MHSTCLLYLGFSYKLSDGTVKGNPADGTGDDRVGENKLGTSVYDFKTRTAKFKYGQWDGSWVMWYIDLGGGPVAGSRYLDANLAEFTFRVTTKGATDFSEVTFREWILYTRASKEEI